MNIDTAAFVRSWLDAWNAHDVEGVLSHFHDDAVFTSPFAARVVPDSDGVLRGKDVIRRYWMQGIELIPDLRFDVVDVYTGIDIVVINYRNQRGNLVCEVLRFDGDLVREGHGTYAGADQNPTGAAQN